MQQKVLDYYSSSRTNMASIEPMPETDTIYMVMTIRRDGYEYQSISYIFQINTGKKSVPGNK